MMGSGSRILLNLTPKSYTETSKAVIVRVKGDLMRPLVAILLFTLLPLAAIAQNAPVPAAIAQNAPVPNTPRWEISAGYEYFRADSNGAQKLANSLTNSFSPPLPAINVGSGLSMNGGNFAVEENVNNWFGGTIDFGGSYGNRHIDLSQ